MLVDALADVDVDVVAARCVLDDDGVNAGVTDGVGGCDDTAAGVLDSLLPLVMSVGGGVGAVLGAENVPDDAILLIAGDVSNALVAVAGGDVDNTANAVCDVVVDVVAVVVVESVLFMLVGAVRESSNVGTVITDTDFGVFRAA